MKDVLIDLYKIKEVHSGLGQFSINFGKAMLQQPVSEFDIHYLISKKSPTPNWIKAANIERSSLSKRFFPSKKTYDLWHTLHQFPRFSPNKNTPWMITIHDLNFLVEKEEHKIKKYLKRLQALVDRAQYITTISNYSKSNIEKYLDLKDKEVHLIYNGIASGREFEKNKPDFIKEGQKFFFTIGHFSQKKNFEVLIPLMKHFPNHRLIIAGNKDTVYGNEIKNLILYHQLNGNVLLPGKICDGTKQWLYANCEALLFPSVAEGFGMPVIEAMYEGKPVFLSRYTALPEIGGKHAFYFDNFDPNQMASLIHSKLECINKNRQSFEFTIKNYANQFNWESCIQGYLDLYRKVLLEKNV